MLRLSFTDRKKKKKLSQAQPVLTVSRLKGKSVLALVWICEWTYVLCIYGLKYRWEPVLFPWLLDQHLVWEKLNQFYTGDWRWYGRNMANKPDLLMIACLFYPSTGFTLQALMSSSDELFISIITSTFQSDPYLISTVTSALTLLTLETSSTRTCSLVSNPEKEISQRPEQQR